MKLINQFLTILVFFFLVVSCTAKKELIINASNPEINYSGRIDKNSTIGAADLIWPGTSVKINFKGSSISAVLNDEKGANYYAVIIDNDSISILNPTVGKKQYQLASGLSEGDHTLELFKRTQHSRGKTSFYGFQIKDKAKLLAKSPEKELKIEIYGNSISAGYAIDDLSGGDNGAGEFNNNYLAYGALTARHFNADYRCICKGGIGITISWFPYTMPDIYDKLNPNEPNSNWDFTKYTPDVVVVNLFQNDSWLVKKTGREDFKNNFGDTPPSDTYIINAYKDFISSIREKYPNANIICALGSMDATKEGSKWPGYIEKAVSNLKDEKIHTLVFPYKETNGHPNVKEQEQIANQLIAFINKNISW